MHKSKRVQRVKKTKSAEYTTPWTRWDETKSPPPANRAALNDPAIRLADAKAAFDAAQVECVKACLAFAIPGAIPTIANSPRAMAAQDAGFAMIDAYAAVLRAREETPITVTLTPAAEAAKLKSKAPAKRRGSK